MKEEDVPSEVRKQLKEMSDISDPEDALGPFNRSKIKHGEYMISDESTMRGIGQDGGMHTRNVVHEMSARSGDKVSIKYADFSEPRHFRQFLDDFDLERCGTYSSRVHEENGEFYGEKEDYIWCNRDLVVTTSCDPITGEGGDNCEVGYTSYLTATGDSRSLEHMYMKFHMNRGTSPSRKELTYYEGGDVVARD